MGSRIVAAFLCVVAFCAAQKIAYEQQLAKVLITVQTARSLAEFYGELRPGTAAEARSAVEAWLESYRLAGIDGHAREALGAQYAAAVRAVDAQRVTLRNAAAGPLKAAPSFAEFLRRNATFDLARTLPAEVAAVQARLGGQPAGSGAAAVYTVAELNSIVGRAMAGAGTKSEKQARALAEVRRLGPRLLIRGAAGRRNSLDFEDETFRGKTSVYIWSFQREAEEEELRRMTGRTVTVECSVRKVEILIEVERCRLAPEAASLASSGTPFFAEGFVRKEIAKESLAVAAGQGVTVAEVEGVYLLQGVGFGAGGFVSTTFEPALLLKNGLIYDDPHAAPDSFDPVRSQQKEPQHWGRFTRAGEGGAIVTLDGKERKVTRIFPAIPGRAGLTLAGTYSHSGGGGNLAYGGSTTIATNRRFTFRGSRFETDSYAGASGGGDYNPDGGTRVTVQSGSAPAAGSYSIDGWAIELTYDHGKRERLLFCSQDATFRYVCIGGTMFLRREK